MSKSLAIEESSAAHVSANLATALSSSRISRLPVEILMQIVSSLDHDGHRRTLALLCQVNQLFCKLARPSVFREISYDISWAKIGLRGQSGIALGASVRQTAVDVRFELSPLCRKMDWQPAELKMARRITQSHLQKAFTLLDLCTNLECLTFDFSFWDATYEIDSIFKDDGFFLNPSFDNIFPSIRTADLLAMPCINSLRMLCLCSSESQSYLQSACDGFDTGGFGEFIVAAGQLEKVKLVDFYHALLFSPLKMQLADNSGKCKLRELEFSLEMDRGEWDEPFDNTWEFLEDLGFLPCVSRLVINIPVVWLDEGELVARLPSTKRVTQLVVQANDNIKPEYIQTCVQYAPALESFHIKLCDNDVQLDGHLWPPASSWSEVTILTITISLPFLACKLAERLETAPPAKQQSAWAVYHPALFPALKRCRLELEVPDEVPTEEWMHAVAITQEDSAILPLHIQAEIIIQPDSSCRHRSNYFKSLVREETGWRERV